MRTISMRIYMLPSPPQLFHGPMMLCCFSCKQSSRQKFSLNFSSYVPYRIEEFVLQVYPTTTILFRVLGTIYVHVFLSMAPRATYTQESQVVAAFQRDKQGPMNVYY